MLELFFQYLVAGRVTMGVVNRLELVNIQHEERQVVPVAATARDLGYKITATPGRDR